MTWIDDGCGNFWPDKCPDCGADMQVVRPGDCRCSNECGRIVVHIMFPDGSRLPAKMTGMHIMENLHRMIIDAKFEVKLSPGNQVMLNKLFKETMKEWYRE